MPLLTLDHEDQAIVAHVDKAKASIVTLGCLRDCLVNLDTIVANVEAGVQLLEAVTAAGTVLLFILFSRSG